MLDMVHLRSFVVVAEELHFGRAAMRLHMTQPPLSRQIRLLEEELGVALLTRSSHRVELTAAGQAFLPEARAVLQRSEAAAQAARRAAGLDRGVLQIGFVGASTFSFLPRLVLRAGTELSGTTLVLREMGAPEQMEALAVGRIDLGLVRPQPLRPELHATCVMREGLSLVLPAGHPLALKRRPTLQHVKDQPFIMYGPGAPYLHQLLSALFAEHNIHPIVVQEATQAQSILSLVSVGLGIAIVPEEARHACFGSVVFRPLNLDVAAELHAIRRAADDRPLLQQLEATALRVAPQP
jgi:DNA-binding transcriptional LysR family regulator